MNTCTIVFDCRNADNEFSKAVNILEINRTCFYWLDNLNNTITLNKTDIESVIDILHAENIHGFFIE